MGVPLLAAAAEEEAAAVEAVSPLTILPTAPELPGSGVDREREEVSKLRVPTLDTSTWVGVGGDWEVSKADTLDPTDTPEEGEGQVKL